MLAALIDIKNFFLCSHQIWLGSWILKTEEPTEQREKKTNACVFLIETPQEESQGQKIWLIITEQGKYRGKRLKGKDHEGQKTTPALRRPQLVLHRADEAPNLPSFSALPLWPPPLPLPLSFLFSHLLSLLVNSPSPLLHTVIVVYSSISLLLTHAAPTFSIALLLWFLLPWILTFCECGLPMKCSFTLSFVHCHGMAMCCQD